MEHRNEVIMHLLDKIMFFFRVIARKKNLIDKKNLSKKMRRKKIRNDQ